MIETLTLENFKSLKNQTFHFNNLTLFTGLNSMGKSSVLQSLLLMRQSYENNMLPNVGLSLVGKYVTIGNGSDLLFVNADNELIKYQIHWTASELSASFKSIQNSNLLPITKGFVFSENCFKESLFTTSFQYLSAERIAPKSSFAVSDYDINSLNSIGKTGEFTAHFIAEKGLKPLVITKLKHHKANTDNLIDNINAWMSEITPGTRVVASVLPEINQASLHYKFETADYVTKPFRPENVGFGLTYVLPVVTAVLGAKKGDLLLIENPESHIHPAGQSALAKLIAIAAENGVQLLIESHSDHFLNGLRIAVKNQIISNNKIALFYLSRDLLSSNHCVEVKQPRIAVDGRIDEWPKGFFDEWDKSLDELLDER